MNLIHRFFSSKKNAWLFILPAVFCRIVNVLFVSEGGRDKIYLALQTRNFLEGKGLSISKYFSFAPDTPIYDFTPMWPPGYPILLAPFLRIFNYDVYWATTTLDIISCIAIIFIVRKITMILKFPMAAINIATLIAGCFDYAFIYQSLPTDASSFAIFLFGLLMLMGVVQKEKINYFKLIVASFFLFLPCTFRYSYPPLSIAAFAAVIFAGWYLRNKLLIRKGLLGFSFLSILLIAFFISLKLLTGKAGYIVETQRGFYPTHLLDWAPIGPGAFINTFFTTSQLIRFTGISVEQAMDLLEIISALMLSGLTIIIFYLFFKKKFFKTINPFKWFLLSGFFVAAATCISLGYLSLTYKPQPGWGNYLGEPRYFMFVTLYIQLAFIGWIFIYNEWKKNLLQKIVVYTLSLLLFIEISHSIYFNTKVALSYDKYRSAAYKEPDYVYFSEMIKPLMQQNPNTDIFILSHSDEFYPLMGSYLGLKGIFDAERFTRSPSLKNKNILILALYDPELPVYQTFLNAQKAQLIKRVNNVNFYRVDIVK